MKGDIEISIEELRKRLKPDIYNANKEQFDYIFKSGMKRNVDKCQKVIINISDLTNN